MGWSLKSISNYSKLLLVFALITGYLIFYTAVDVWATGPERDYDEKYKDIPGAPECWYDGYIDGQDHPFNHDRNEECKDKGNQY